MQTVILSESDVCKFLKEEKITSFYRDVYYKKGNSCVRRRFIYDRERIFLSEGWIDVYGNPIHKPQVERVLLKYKFTRHHLLKSNIKLDVLKLDKEKFVVLIRVESLFLKEMFGPGKPCSGKVHLLTSKLDLQGYIFNSDPFLV